jgi:hypothetical protein
MAANHQCAPCGQVGKRARGGLFQRPAVGHGREPFLGHGGVFGKGALLGDAREPAQHAHGVTGFQPAARHGFHHLARAVTSGGKRRRAGARVLSLHKIAVGRVQRGARDAHQRLAGARLHVGNLLQHQIGNVSGLMKPPCTHVPRLLV